MKKVLFWIGATLFVGIGGLFVLSVSILALSMGYTTIADMNPIVWKSIGITAVSVLLGYVIWGQSIALIYERWFGEDQ